MSISFVEGTLKVIARITRTTEVNGALRKKKEVSAMLATLELIRNQVDDCVTLFGDVPQNLRDPLQTIHNEIVVLERVVEKTDRVLCSFWKSLLGTASAGLLRDIDDLQRQLKWRYCHLCSLLKNYLTYFRIEDRTARAFVLKHLFVGQNTQAIFSRSEFVDALAVEFRSFNRTTLERLCHTWIGGDLEGGIEISDLNTFVEPYKDFNCAVRVRYQDTLRFLRAGLLSPEKQTMEDTGMLDCWLHEGWGNKFPASSQHRRHSASMIQTVDTVCRSEASETDQFRSKNSEFVVAGEELSYCSSDVFSEYFAEKSTWEGVEGVEDSDTDSLPGMDSQSRQPRQQYTKPEQIQMLSESSSDVDVEGFPRLRLEDKRRASFEIPSVVGKHLADQGEIVWDYLL